MNYKHNINYFKDGDGLKLLGIALAVVGGLVFYFGWSYISYILSCIAIPVGLFLFFWSTGRRSRDEDLDEDIRERCKGATIDWSTENRLFLRRNKEFDPFVLGGYEYRNGLLFKKTKDGALRSTLYTTAEIAVLEDALYIFTTSFSLIADECTDQKIEISFSDIQGIELTDEEKQLTCGKNTFRVKDHRLVLRYGEENIISLPVNHSLEVDLFVERLRRVLPQTTA